MRVNRFANVLGRWASKRLLAIEMFRNFSVAKSVVVSTKTGEVSGFPAIIRGVQGTAFTLGLAAQMKTVPRQQQDLAVELS